MPKPPASPASNPARPLAGLFPETFLWGASTSGHQVEGSNYDQWTVWELEHASELARSAKKRLGDLPNWPDIEAQAQNPENYVSGKGVEHYHKYREDFAIAHKLNLTSLRFSLEWSRIEPEAGVWNQAEIDHYHNYIEEMKKQGIEPLLNLWHWTHPVWFEERGGFGRRENLAFWTNYIQKVAEEFGDSVRYVIILNEPNIYVSYPEWNKGVPVPPQASKFQRLLMFFALVKAHKAAYRILKRANPALQIGTAVQMANNQPKDAGKFIDKMAVRLADYFGNWLFVSRVKRSIDFIGFNYYFTNYLDGFKVTFPKQPKNDLGWYMEPGGVGDVILKLWLKYRKPIMVTENGLADASDAHRQWWIKETMLALIKTRQLGVELIGYFHWSLLDNFEWAYGWWPKFGLVAVDRNHGMKRRVRASAQWWASQLEKIQR